MIKKIINIALFLTLFLLPLIIFPCGKFPDTYNTPKIILLYGCGIILLICLLIKYKELKFDKTDKILLLFLFLTCISTIFSVNVKESIFGTFNRYEGLLTFICYFLIYYSTKYYFNFNKKIINVSLICLFIINVIAILQYYNIPPIHEIFKSKYFGNSFASATFGNRNFYGSFLSICVPYTMCLYIFNNKKIYLLFSSISFIGLLVSLTRSAWLAFIICSIIGIIYIIKCKNKFFIKKAIVLLITFVSIFILFYLSNTKTLKVRYNSTIKDITSIANNVNINTNTNTNSNSNNNDKQISTSNHKIGSGRVLIWEAAIKIIAKNPIIGCGPDAFLSELCNNHLSYLINDLHPKLKSFPDKAHNEYLQIASTIGIPALLLYLTFIILTLKKLIKNNLLESNQWFILFLCLIGYLIQAFFNISTIGVAPIFYFLLGYSYQVNDTVRLKDKN